MALPKNLTSADLLKFIEQVYGQQLMTWQRSLIDEITRPPGPTHWEGHPVTKITYDKRDVRIRGLSYDKIIVAEPRR